MKRLTMVALVLGLGLVAGCKKKDATAPSTGSAQGGSATSGGGAAVGSGGGAGSAAVATAAGGAVGDLPVVTDCPKSLGGSEKVARTIKKECGPIVITESLNIEGSLTLEAGVVLKFQPDTELVVGYNGTAKLIVKGGDAPDQRVVFTSNGDKAAGVWKGVMLHDGADRSSITGLDVEYAGQADGAAVTLRSAVDVTFTKSTIKHAKDRGLEARETSTFAAFTGNGFDDIGKVALAVEPSTVGSLGAGNTFAKDAFVEVHGGKIPVDATWRNVGAPYHVDEEIGVDTATTPSTLTLTDVTLVFASGSKLSVGYGTKGRLVVTGPAVLTSLDGKPGSWGGVVVYDSGEATIDNATLSGGGADDGGGVLTAKGSAKLTLGAVTFKDNKVGLWLDDGAVFSAPKPLTFAGNERAAHVAATPFGGLSGANVYADGQIVEIAGGQIHADTTWSTQPKAAIQISDEVSVADSRTLTIAAGGTYAWKTGAKLSVGYGGTGTLKILGKADAPVTFTALGKGDQWEGVKLFDEARGVELTQLVLADVTGDGGVIAKQSTTGKLDHVSCARCAATFVPDCNAKIEATAVTAGVGTKVATKKADGC
jgi:hypothetical protein